MMVKQAYSTDRLILNPMKTPDAPFILKLLNSPGWLEFIGDRKIRDIAGATQYIENFDNSSDAIFWVVAEKSSQEPLGVVSLIQRTYLPFPDIGFAFMPEFSKKGFAFEAANCIFENSITTANYKVVLGTTLQSNVNSQRLLERLGLVYVKNILIDEEDLMLYSSDRNRTEIDLLIEDFYASFKNTTVDWGPFYDFFTADATIVKMEAGHRQVFDVESFLAPRKALLRGGVLTDFSEVEVKQSTQIEGALAHRFSSYKKNGLWDGKLYVGQGNKSFQFVQTRNGWKIQSLTWEKIETTS